MLEAQMTKELLQQAYDNLCRELGHLQSNKKKIEDRISEIATQISALDRLAGEIAKKDQDVKN
jgi:chromosome segregation ATPase